MIETAAQFIERARKVRHMNGSLVNDIRYLWWALSEIRTCTAEPMEVLDCSPVGDALFATLMALRMKPCEANYLCRPPREVRRHKIIEQCGVSDYVVPILDGNVPQCNPYDAIIIDTDLSRRAGATKSLEAVIASCAWRFTRIFIRHGDQGHLFAGLYQTMRKTMKWSKIPHTTIVLGHMSEQWCHSIAPPS